MYSYLGPDPTGYEAALFILGPLAAIVVLSYVLYRIFKK